MKFQKINKKISRTVAETFQEYIMSLVKIGHELLSTLNFYLGNEAGEWVFEKSSIGQLLSEFRIMEGENGSIFTIK